MNDSLFILIAKGLRTSLKMSNCTYIGPWNKCAWNNVYRFSFHTIGGNVTELQPIYTRGEQVIELGVSYRTGLSILGYTLWSLENEK